MFGSLRIPIAVRHIDLDPPHSAASELCLSSLARLRQEGYLSAVFYMRRNGCPVGRLDVPRLDAEGTALGSNLLAAKLDEVSQCETPAAPADEPSVDVVVCTKGRPQAAARCVKSIMESSWFARADCSSTLFLVDNDPHHEVNARILRTLAEDHARCQYVPCTTPGSSAARNAGIAASSAEIIVFTDDDVQVDDRWVTELVREFTDPSIFCVTGLVLPMALDTAAQVHFEQYGGFGKGYSRRVFRKNSKTSNALYPYAPGAYGSGNNMALRSTWIDKHGGFSLLLGPGTPTMAGEDLEVFLRGVLDGHTIIYTPRAIVHHEHRRSEDELAKQLFGYGCGLTALLTFSALRDKKHAFGIGRRLLPGIAFLFGKRSTKNSKKSKMYPARLTRAEIRGMAVGPFRLAKSYRRHLGDRS